MTPNDFGSLSCALEKEIGNQDGHSSSHRMAPDLPYSSLAIRRAHVGNFMNPRHVRGRNSASRRNGKRVVAAERRLLVARPQTVLEAEQHLNVVLSSWRMPFRYRYSTAGSLLASPASTTPARFAWNTSPCTKRASSNRAVVQSLFRAGCLQRWCSTAGFLLRYPISTPPARFPGTKPPCAAQPLHGRPASRRRMQRKDMDSSAAGWLYIVFPK